MPLPPKLRTKFLARFDDLIQQGEHIHDSIRIEVKEGRVFYPSEARQLFGATPTRGPSYRYEVVDRSALDQWLINCVSLLDQVISKNSIQRKLIETFDGRNFNKQEVSKQLAALRAIKEDFEQGFLEDIALQIEAEFAADYMGQAEQLIAGGQTGKWDHVAAAVLAGAVLEQSLRTLCTVQTPPIPTINNKGPLTLNPLIEELKKAGVFNEIVAKHLRAWADIRNAAAHGETEKINRSQVAQMIQGINSFLADHMPG